MSAQTMYLINCSILGSSTVCLPALEVTTIVMVLIMKETELIGYSTAVVVVANNKASTQKIYASKGLVLHFLL